MLLPYTLVSLVLDFTQMVLAVRKNLKPIQFYLLNNIYLNNFPQNLIPETFPKNQSLGTSSPLPYTLVSLVLDFSQMVLAVWKHL